MSENGVEGARMYGKIETVEVVVELTVQGAPDETTADITDTFDELFERRLENVSELPECDDDDRRGAH